MAATLPPPLAAAHSKWAMHVCTHHPVRSRSTSPDLTPRRRPWHNQAGDGCVCRVDACGEFAYTQIEHQGLVKNLLGIALHLQLHPHDLTTSLAVLNELEAAIGEDDEAEAAQTSESIRVSALTRNCILGTCAR